jgi:hypothetical protein
MKAQMAVDKEQEIRSCIPLEGEVAMVQEWWTNYLTAIETINASFYGTITKLHSARGIKRVDHGSNNGYHSSSEAVPLTSMSNPVNEVNGQNLITGTKPPDPIPMEPRVSFWRSFIKFIYSC